MDISDVMRNTVVHAETNAQDLQQGDPEDHNYPDWAKVNPLLIKFRGIIRKRLLVNESVTGA